MKSNKTILIVVVVIIFLGLATFGVWSFVKKSQARQVSDSGIAITPQNDIIPTDNSNPVKGSVFDLIKLGKTLKCSYSVDTQDVKMNGTSYISGDKMRGDFETTDAAGQKIQSHMISDGTWIYSWTSASPQGIKMNIAETQSNASEITSDKANVDKNVSALTNPLDYKCNAWVEDTSLFVVPSDVKFTDFSETLKNLGTGDKNALCAACSYAQSDADKAACLNQFNCQ